jgi:hypothetical protein
MEIAVMPTISEATNKDWQVSTSAIDCDIQWRAGSMRHMDEAFAAIQRYKMIEISSQIARTTTLAWNDYTLLIADDIALLVANGRTVAIGNVD